MHNYYYVFVLIHKTYGAVNDELSPETLPSPSDDKLLYCLTKCRTSSGNTSSLRCTENDVACLFLRKPRRFFVPFVFSLVLFC